MIAKVILNNKSRATDFFYDYIIPENMIVSVGMRVVVPFGRGNKTTEGYVVDVFENSEFENLKSITDLVDEFVYFTEKGVKLAEFMHHRYFCTYSEALKLLLPPSVNTKFKYVYSIVEGVDAEKYKEDLHSVVSEKIIDLLIENEKLTFEELTERIKGKNIRASLLKLKELNIINEKVIRAESIKDTEKQVVYPALDVDELYLYAESIRKKAPKQASIIETVCDYNGIYLSELLDLCDVTHSTVNTLVKKECIYLKKQIVRNELEDLTECDEAKSIKLSEQQESIINQVGSGIDSGDRSTYLLHGVTGSGKTEIYLNLIEKCIKNGKNAIFLVPEISLTPQMIKQVVSRFGESVAVLHSSLSLRERYDQWKKVKSGEVHVVVGARSAVFAPFENIGLIIIDEEHETSYKSEISPKYSTVEVARFLAKQFDATLLLASATPSVESYYLASTGKIKLLELKNRINNVPMPEIEIVDMRKELKKGNTGILSEKLIEEIRYNIENKLKTILFLNRRGYSGFIQCRSCGHVVECPDCNISMTYHKNSSSLVCHYCDYKTPLIQKCPQCGSKHLKFSGDGTQKAENDISEIFPDAKILRMDADTTSSRNAHKEILKKFEEDDTDILIGTQMVTKGLDFEKVTLVGVLSADMSLHTDDFRSDEKTFDLITQVCGRAGRGKYRGKAVIQTYDPENETIQNSGNLDYAEFYKREIEVRKLLVYPPFCEIINFIFSAESDAVAHMSAIRFHSMLKCALSDAGCVNQVIAYSVTPAPIHKINGKYRYRFIMKLNYSKAVYDVIHKASQEYRKEKNAANLSIDTNPYNMN